MMNLLILIVDDNLSLLEVLTERLKANGYDVITCSSTFEAVTQAREKHPDLILLDYKMSDITGLLIQKKLNELPALKNVPILFISAWLDESIKEEAKKNGAVGFIQKPYDSADLLKKVKEAIHGSRNRNTRAKLLLRG